MVKANSVFSASACDRRLARGRTAKVNAGPGANCIEYIEMFYNSERVHQVLNYCTPSELEARFFDHEMVLTPVSRLG